MHNERAMGSSGLSIGKVAAQAGVNVQTLRYYERSGLLQPPPRRVSGYRAYGPDAVHVVRFIKQAQRLGFTLGEISDLLLLRAGTAGSCADARNIAELKIADIDRRIAQLAAMRTSLQELVATCGAGKRTGCAIVEALDLAARGEGREVGS